MNSSRDKYEARTQKKKEAIIEAALFFFCRDGFKGTGIKEIAAKAQVSQVSIYNYFGSKDALVLECASRLMHEIIQKANQLLETDLPFLDKLNKALSLCSGQINQSLTGYFSDEALADKDLMKLLQDGVTQLQKEMYSRYIEAGKEEGYIDSAYPTSTILKYIMAFNTISIDPEHYKEELALLHRLFLEGMLNKK